LDARKKVMIKQGLAALLAAGSLSGLGGTAIAQQIPTPITQTQPTRSPLNSSAVQFLTQTAQDSNYELASSEQALQQAVNPQVARIALHVYDDHAQFQRALLQLARQYNLRLTPNLTAQDQSRLASLSAQQGTAFDQAYIQQLAQSNTSSISQFQSAASTVNNADVQGFISNFFATQQSHLQLANTIPH
jgi:putative membrane protein